MRQRALFDWYHDCLARAQERKLAHHFETSAEPPGEFAFYRRSTSWLRLASKRESRPR